MSPVPATPDPLATTVPTPIRTLEHVAIEDEATRLATRILDPARARPLVVVSITFTTADAEPSDADREPPRKSPPLRFPWSDVRRAASGERRACRRRRSWTCTGGRPFRTACRAGTVGYGLVKGSIAGDSRTLVERAPFTHTRCGRCALPHPSRRAARNAMRDRAEYSTARRPTNGCSRRHERALAGPPPTTTRSANPTCGTRTAISSS